MAAMAAAGGPRERAALTSLHYASSAVGSLAIALVGLIGLSIGLHELGHLMPAKAFGVKVTNVNTLNRKGKASRNRKTGKYTSKPDSKRAIVTLAAGDEIPLFEH